MWDSMARARSALPFIGSPGKHLPTIAATSNDARHDGAPAQAARRATACHCCGRRNRATTAASIVAMAVQDGAADLGFVEGRVDADDLIQQAVARDRVALVVSPTHPWASRRRGKGPELLAAEWVLRERGSGTRSEFEDVLRRWTFSTDRLNVVLELPSNEAVRMAVEAGAGASVISRLVAEPSLRARNLKVIAFELPERAFTALRHRERYFSKAAQALLNEIRGAKLGN